MPSEFCFSVYGVQLAFQLACILITVIQYFLRAVATFLSGV